MKSSKRCYGLLAVVVARRADQRQRGGDTPSLVRRSDTSAPWVKRALKIDQTQLSWKIAVRVRDDWLASSLGKVETLLNEKYDEVRYYRLRHPAEMRAAERMTLLEIDKNAGIVLQYEAVDHQGNQQALGYTPDSPSRHCFEARVRVRGFVELHQTSQQDSVPVTRGPTATAAHFDDAKKRQENLHAVGGSGSRERTRRGPVT